MREKLFIKTIKDNPTATIDWFLERFRYIEELLKKNAPSMGHNNNG